VCRAQVGELTLERLKVHGVAVAWVCGDDIVMADFRLYCTERERKRIVEDQKTMAELEYEAG
jgi:hypothetical protein